MRRNAESEIINGGRTTLVIPNEVRDRGFAGTGLRADLDFGWRSASSAAIAACHHCSFGPEISRKVYFLVAFPSITVDHFPPSGDISNTKV
jgi:hypothetical protein